MHKIQKNILFEFFVHKKWLSFAVKQNLGKKKIFWNFYHKKIILVPYNWPPPDFCCNKTKKKESGKFECWSNLVHFFHKKRNKFCYFFFLPSPYFWRQNGQMTTILVTNLSMPFWLELTTEIQNITLCPINR